MSTDTLTRPDALTLEGISQPCDLNEKRDTPCTLPADWVGVLKCCGSVRLMCDEHKEAFMDKLASPMIFGCMICKTFHPNSPFASLERL